MPIPKAIARLNRVAVNPVVRRMAPRMPGLGVVVHRGRRSGRVYRTPVNVHRRPEGYVFVLHYGPDTDWVRNVVAAGGCEIETRGQRVQLESPRVYRDEDLHTVPAPIRPLLRLLGVADFLVLRTVQP